MAEGDEIGATWVSKTVTFLKTVIFVAALVGMEVAGWLKTHQLLVIFYLFLFWLFATARILNWPHPSWWGSAHVDSVKQAWGQRKFDRRYTPADSVNRLSEFVAAKSFIVSSTYHDNTERLCNSYIDGLTMRLVGFGIAALFLCINPQGQSFAIGDSVEGLLKLFGALMPAILTVVWDYSRFERQRFWNRELKPPQLADPA